MKKIQLEMLRRLQREVVDLKSSMIVTYVSLKVLVAFQQYGVIQTKRTKTENKKEGGQNITWLVEFLASIHEALSFTPELH